MNHQVAAAIASQAVASLSCPARVAEDVSRFLATFTANPAAPAPDPIFTSEFSSIVDARLLRYYYFDGLPLAVRIAYYAAVRSGLLAVPPAAEARWTLFESYMEELQAREACLATARTVGGWLFAGESETLWEVAHDAAEIDGQFCEIGAWLGRSTTIWCGALDHARSPKSLFVVDNWLWGVEGVKYPFLITGRDLRAEFDWNTRAHAGRITTFQALSEEATCQIEKTLAGRGLALLFHDGSHDYADVLADLTRFVPLLNAGGLLVIHDYRNPDFPGVSAAVDDYVGSTSGIETCYIVNTLAVLRRASPASSRPESHHIPKTRYRGDAW